MTSENAERETSFLPLIVANGLPDKISVGHVWMRASHANEPGTSWRCVRCKLTVSVTTNVGAAAPACTPIPLEVQDREVHVVEGQVYLDGYTHRTEDPVYDVMQDDDRVFLSEVLEKAVGKRVRVTVEVLA